jgi:hypothetical protein
MEQMVHQELVEVMEQMVPQEHQELAELQEILVFQVVKTTSSITP